jgi:hypothetical protein
MPCDVLRPFANLPEARAGRWGEGLTEAKMKNCRVADAGAGGAVRVCGVDAGQAPEAFAVCGTR